MKNMDFDFFPVSFVAAIRLYVCLPLPLFICVLLYCCHGSFLFILRPDEMRCDAQIRHFTLEEFVYFVIAYCLCVYRKHSAHSHKIIAEEEWAAAAASVVSVPIPIYMIMCAVCRSTNNGCGPKWTQKKKLNLESTTKLSIFNREIKRNPLNRQDCARALVHSFASQNSISATTYLGRLLLKTVLTAFVFIVMTNA